VGAVDTFCNEGKNAESCEILFLLIRYSTIWLLCVSSCFASGVGKPIYYHGPHKWWNTAGGSQKQLIHPKI